MGSHKSVSRGDAHPPGEVADFIDFAEVAAPATPASGFVRQYAKTDGALYQKDDAGTETALGGGGGGGSSEYVFIAESVLGSAGTFQFASIPATYRELKLVGRLRGANSVQAATVTMRVGNSTVDAGANYNSGFSYDRSATSDSMLVAAGGTWLAVALVPGATTTSTAFSAIEIDIFDYADTARRRHMLTRSAGYDSTSGVTETHGGGEWINTSDVIDIIELQADSFANNFAAGSRLALYGIG